ncbi:trk system potassium uptake protein TrkH [Methylohalomonas lacus]|uniref:Trk system potassium uptake protein n=1 Tax=Methylohalomonas lacus TaxID=398773 RepID=A0AAE3L247_9GAMM|nr:TrkH family potassium uptake protein [Methylohalomonas lacus]MCS3904495.1 trk system potassium uptake protein TrkH [Methylohalomonas lacus]
MQLTAIQRILGLLLALFSLTLLPPLAISWFARDGAAFAFLLAWGLILTAGLIMWLPVRNIRTELKLRDGFIVVVLFWVSLGLSGAIPLLLSEFPRLSITDAVFESMSGLTTTGATVLTGIDSLPLSVLFYRQQLQWMGGMGIIVLAVAILPMLGIGGMQLYKAEIPGPLKDAKLTPRITETAKALWYVYLGMTILCALSYWVAGMTPFDAIAHSFSTVSIGGFSTHDASIGYFDSTAIELVAVFFMLLGGMNFTLHFLAWRSFSLRPYLHDSEVRAYVTFLFALSLVTIVYLLYIRPEVAAADSLRDGLFQSVSIATTSGFTTASYQNWPTFLPVLLLFASFVGGCATSTGGGLKVIRVLLLVKQGLREVRRLIHPNAIFSIKLGGRSLPDRVVNAVWGFFAAYVAVFTLLMLLLLATGLDQITAFSAMAACLNNLGPGLGDVSAHYGPINDTAKWVLVVAMLLGRLEIFTLLVILTPAFWKK